MFDTTNPKDTPANVFVSGKSAHAILAAIAAGELPKGVTPQAAAQADVDRQARKAERKSAAE